MPAPPYRAIRMLMYDRPEEGHGWTEMVRPAAPAAGSNFTHVCPNNAWELIRTCAFTLTTAAVAGQRQPVINYLDGDGGIWDQVLAGPSPGGSTTAQTFMDDKTPAASVPSPSVSGTGVVTGPAAGQAIASISLTAGTYTINWRVAVGGTTAAAEQDNFQLVVGATVVAVSENGSSSGTDVQQLAVTIDVPTSGATVSVQAVANGTGTATYRATLTSTPQAGLTYYGTLPDLLLRPGYGFQVAVTNIQAGDQLSGIVMHVQRFPSDWAGGSTYRDEVAEWLEAEQAMRAGG